MFALTASDPANGDYFGTSVSLSGDTMAVGACYKNTSQGAAYAFTGIRGNALNQTWALDAVGNWPSSTLNGTAQARDHSKANEVSTINASSTDVGNDLAGNLTRMPRLVGNDVVGHYVCVYDSWNRLIKLQSDGTTPIVYVTMAYDGRGRRISKAVSNSGDLNCTYHYYLDGDSMIEVRNGSDQVLKQQVWGVTYIDELVQEGVNTTLTTNSPCDTFYWACQDANYNVNLLVDSQGVKVERYAYTPYGVRTAYKASDAGDAQLTLAIGSSQAVMVGSVAQPYGLCEFGHQGLQHDEESGLIYVRHRYMQPVLGRWMSRDPIGEPSMMMTDFTQVPIPSGMAFVARDSSDINALAAKTARANLTSSLGKTAGDTPLLWQYSDGMSLYLDARSNPITRLDPSGLDIFINCNESPHLSICVGSLTSFTCFSFGLQNRWQIFNPWNSDGIVYINPMSPSTQICVRCHLKSTPAQDKDALSVLNGMVGTTDRYRLWGASCRSFSYDMCDWFQKQYGLAPKSTPGW